MTGRTVARDQSPATASTIAPRPDLDAVDALVTEMTAAIKAEQRPDGHWLFELEADATIPAEYIFLQHFLGRVDTPQFREIEPKIANHLRSIQGGNGGWPLFHDGDMDLSASVKA
jgi:squalene-hopene/tetraprenyl-beta-curcumene cyclase